MASKKNPTGGQVPQARRITQYWEREGLTWGSSTGQGRRLQGPGSFCHTASRQASFSAHLVDRMETSLPSREYGLGSCSCLAKWGLVRGELRLERAADADPSFLSPTVTHGPSLLSFPSSLCMFSQKPHVIKERSQPCPRAPITWTRCLVGTFHW